MLEHQLAVVNGIRIFGSPFTPTFGTGWAYNKDRGKLHNVWATVPECDVLVTHGPPKGILDLSKENVSTGCSALRKRVIELKPKVHVFGHIHEQAGSTMTIPDCETKFINACVMTLEAKIVSNGIIVDL
jgi:Icc-related predicted phosphoesterase